MDRVTRSGLDVDRRLALFLEDEALPGTGIRADAFWDAFADLIRDLGPTNRDLLDTRAALQAQLDTWYSARAGKPHDPAEYKAFLLEIGYLVPEGPDFLIETENTDPEFASIPGPQLVVPVMNARYALNAANARWGSLYDALYGTDALGDLPGGKGFDPARGARVIDWAKGFLDDIAPLASGSHRDVDRVFGQGRRAGARLARSGPVRGLSGGGRCAVGDCGDPQPPARRYPYRPQPFHRQGRSGGGGRYRAGIGDFGDHGLRGQRRRGGRRGQGDRLPQLAGPDDRRI